MTEEFTEAKTETTETPIAEGKTDSRASNVGSFAKNSVILSFANISVLVLGFVYRWYMTRYLGDTGYGKYFFITTFVSYFSVIALCGFRQVVVRQVAADRKQMGAYLTVGMRLRLITGTVAVIVACVLATVLKRTQPVEVMVFVCAATLLWVAVNDVLEAGFLGIERTEFAAATSILSNVIKVVLGAYLLIHGYGLLAVFVLYLGTLILNTLLNVILLRLRFGLRLISSREGDRKLTKYVLSESMPFLYTSLISKVYYRNDVLVLGWLKGDRVVGWYGAGYLAVDLLFNIGSAVANAVYPVMTRMYVSKSGDMANAFERLCKYIYLVSAPLCVLISLIGASFLPAVLDKRFANGADALRVLIWIIPLEVFCLIIGSVLSATSQQRLIPKVAGFSAVSNLALTLALVPRYSYMGAAWATTIASVLNVTAAHWALNKVLPRASLLRALWRSGVATCIMVGAVLLCRHFQPITAAVLAIVVYAGACLILRVIDLEDRRLAGDLLKYIKDRRAAA